MNPFFVVLTSLHSSFIRKTELLDNRHTCTYAVIRHSESPGNMGLGDFPDFPIPGNDLKGLFSIFDSIWND